MARSRIPLDSVKYFKYLVMVLSLNTKEWTLANKIMRKFWII